MKESGKTPKHTPIPILPALPSPLKKPQSRLRPGPPQAPPHHSLASTKGCQVEKGVERRISEADGRQTMLEPG